MSALLTDEAEEAAAYFGHPLLFISVFLYEFYVLTKLRLLSGRILACFTVPFCSLPANR